MIEYHELKIKRLSFLI